MDNLITAGELAKLTRTTKRTIIWYTQQGVLKPVKTAANGYRYYSERQILDYQMILLLRTLGVSLAEIRDYLLKKGNLSSLFNEKKQQIGREIDNLQYKLRSVEGYLNNLNINGTMVKPEIKILQPFEIYYIEKTGAYSQIGNYCDELVAMFEKPNRQYPQDKRLLNHFTTLSVFLDSGYNPRKCKMLIAVLSKPGMRVKNKYNNIVKKKIFAPGKVITYTFNGPGEMLSFFWKELEKYCRLNNIKIRTDTPDFEIYRKVNTDPSRQFFEIYLPIN